MKILHLEDNRDDADLVRELLTNEWAECEIKVVETKHDYTRELEHGGYDLILSDFSLVRFDGSEALKLAQRQAPGVPFVFLSGNIGEDRAIEAVKSGADDYVTKPFEAPELLVRVEAHEAQKTLDLLTSFQALQPSGI